MESANTQLYVLTGFLGAGKTTVLLKILEAERTQGRNYSE